VYLVGYFRSCITMHGFMKLNFLALRYIIEKMRRTPYCNFTKSSKVCAIGMAALRSAGKKFLFQIIFLSFRSSEMIICFLYFWCVILRTSYNDFSNSLYYREETGKCRGTTGRRGLAGSSSIERGKRVTQLRPGVS
jgi:hypothetical protein